MNMVVLTGVLSSEPKRRALPSGDELVTYEVTTPLEEGVASVPVAWLSPSRPPAVGRGDKVTVVGHVRRRFFRAGGGAASRTEVVATIVARPGTKRATAAVRKAVDGLVSTAETHEADATAPPRR